MQRFRLHALIAAAYLGTFLATLDISIVNVALPTLQEALQTDLGGLQWVVNAYAIVLSALMLSAGPLGDKYGHKRMWVASVVLFVVGSIVCACATQLDSLLWGRTIQGVAGALLIPGAMPILTHAFPDPKQRARAIGGWSAFSALALISGPLLGGLLIEHIGWESIFVVNVPLGILAALLGMWGIPERKNPEHAAFDPMGQILSILWLGMLSYGLIEIGEYGASPEKVLLPFGIAAVAFLVFIWVELNVQRPLFPVELFRNRTLALANVASFVLGFTGYASLFFLSLFLQQAQTDSPALTGWHLMPQFVATTAVSLLFGRLTVRIPLKLLMVGGYSLIGLSMCMMLTFGPYTPYIVIGVDLALLGLGMGLAVPATGMMVMGYAPPERAGIASATMNALRQTGMTLGIAVLGSVMGISAIHDMTMAINASGVAGASDLAHRAVVNHILPAGQDWLSDIYRAAMASGFGLAMLCAGLVGLSVAFLLLFFSTDLVTSHTNSVKKAVRKRGDL
ncbi:putative permease of the major facilitator superfamily [Xenorhabdus beddingii]|uniref:Putative permease of the major facilitator superfamily n=1 Tax=Xenorhabdus beddingii TaxID=40578 RepID=A0A1Y2SRL6_9GAMM|nr:MFS transporter [Xenorhabdus beddingii]OTA20795.1 putative permease of the major facilitator superfamily [Xenorhabdus beddingii]